MKELKKENGLSNSSLRISFKNSPYEPNGVSIFSHMFFGLFLLLAASQLTNLIHVSWVYIILTAVPYVVEWIFIFFVIIDLVTGGDGRWWQSERK